MSTEISLRWNKNNLEKMWTEINKKYLTLFFWKKLSHNFCFHYCLQIVSQGIVGLGSDVPFYQDCVRICTTLILTYYYQQRMGTCACAKSLIRVPLFVTTRLLYPWEFSRQEYWSGCHTLLQGIFLTQESNLCLLHLLH